MQEVSRGHGGVRSRGSNPLLLDYVMILIIRKSVEQKNDRKYANAILVILNQFARDAICCRNPSWIVVIIIILR